MEYRQAKNSKLMIEILPDKCDFCGCCVGVCPEDAIELKEAEIFIIDERCTNCSKCIWSCPIEVIVFKKEGVLSLSV
jgi:Fe-S-cluster-containing hydrogenase component 2